MQSFVELDLPQLLVRGLEKVNFIHPTEIQKKAIPLLLEGRDLMARAETGSGKTGAYLIPMIVKLLKDPKSQGLVLVPTRELAQQITEFLRSLVADPKDLYSAQLIGGQDIRKQFKSLQRRPRIIVATPGRLIDHLKRNTVQIHNVGHLVLDEGDRMIDMGFAPQLEQILKYLPSERQTSFFTATLDKKVTGLAQKYLNNPLSLLLDESRPVSTVKQFVVRVELENKADRIVDELNSRKGSVIVFLKTKSRTERLKKHLVEYGFAADLIHGGRTQGQRDRALKAFKSGETRILCATDVAARGIDVPHVEHIINFDLPMFDEDYVHRVGRTARNGALGEAVSFVTLQECRAWNNLVRKYDIPDALIGEGMRSALPGAKRRRSGKRPLRKRVPEQRSGSNRSSPSSYGSRPKRTSRSVAGSTGSW